MQLSTTHSYNEAELLNWISEGDKRAFDTVFELYFAPVTYFALSFLKDRQAAEDIAVETFVSLFRKKPSFPDLHRLKAWLYVNTRNRILNQVRDHRLHGAAHDEIRYLESARLDETAEEAIIRTEALNVLRQEIDRLPDRIRQVIVLSFVEGKTVKEIAQELGTAVQTVQNQKAKGVQLLRAAIIRDNLISAAVLWTSLCLLK